jgi:N-acetylglucosamine-6-sulfatase
MRVPLIMAGGGLPAGRAADAVVANIDIGPTILEAAGLTAPATSMDGRSFLALARGESRPWRDTFLYEYFWERNFPHTPTLHALRGAQYKYIRYHGLWDTDELYDLKADPDEMHNLIRDPAHREVATRMNAELFKVLGATDGLAIRLWPDRGNQQNLRRRSGPRAADFPEWAFGPEK